MFTDVATQIILSGQHFGRFGQYDSYDRAKSTGRQVDFLGGRGRILPVLLVVSTLLAVMTTLGLDFGRGLVSLAAPSVSYLHEHGVVVPFWIL